jgi:hypothetical protein
VNGATVTITIRGRLSERLIAAFDGMSATPGGSRTALTGHVADQAQLHGLLARVRDLGLELESVSVGQPDGAAEGSPRRRGRWARRP